MPKNLKAYNQLTLDRLPIAPKKDPAAYRQVQEKRIIIAEIGTLTKEDELALKVSFKLVPSKTAFLKVQSDLWFDNQKISSISIRIPQGPLAADDFELTPVLGMKGIPEGTHNIKVEMYELWSSGERFSQAEKEVIVAYVPQTRESKFVRIPIIKSVAGTDLSVITASEKDLYRGIEKTMKKEQLSNRDDW
jgi:hypothetical protein